MRLLSIFVLSLLAFPGAAVAVVPLGGDNESGLEFPHSSSQCQWYSPDPGYAIASGHARIIRLPYSATCAVPTEGGPINAGYMRLVAKSIDRVADVGVPVVLDMHAFGALYGNDITTAQGERDFLDVHHKVLAYLLSTLTAAEQRQLIVGLMNEPHQQSDRTYQPVFQAAINQIRADGFRGIITYPEAGWSGAHNLSASSAFMAGVTDPLGTFNIVAEVHQYFDSDYSGTHDEPIASSTLGAATLGGAEAWSARTGIYLILDETGDPQPITDRTVPTSFPAGAWTASDQYFRQFMTDAANSGRFYAIVPWGGGQYWGGYMFNDYVVNGAPSVTGQTYAQLSLQLGQ